MLVCNVHVCGLVACLLSLPSPPTPLRRIQPVLFWRERWHPLIRTALLSLFSNDSGLKTAMLCPLSPIYRYMQSNIIFFAHSLSSYGCVCNRNKLFYCLLFTVYCLLFKPSETQILAKTFVETNIVAETFYENLRKSNVIKVFSHNW
jgi:hypothetical protein